MHVARLALCLVQSESSHHLAVISYCLPRDPVSRGRSLPWGWEARARSPPSSS